MDLQIVGAVCDRPRSLGFDTVDGIDRPYSGTILNCRDIKAQDRGDTGGCLGCGNYL